MRGLPSSMLLSGALLLLAATSADDMATHKRSAVRVATATVTIIRAERVTLTLDPAEPPKQGRQIRKRQNKPLIEFH